MIDLDSHIMRIQNKVEKTLSKIYVYKDGSKFISSSTELPGRDYALVGAYLRTKKSYKPSIIDEDIRWANKEMK